MQLHGTAFSFLKDPQGETWKQPPRKESRARGSTERKTPHRGCSTSTVQEVTLHKRNNSDFIRNKKQGQVSHILNAFRQFLAMGSPRILVVFLLFPFETTKQGTHAAKVPAYDYDAIGLFNLRPFQGLMISVLLFCCSFDRFYQPRKDPNHILVAFLLFPLKTTKAGSPEKQTPRVRAEPATMQARAWQTSLKSPASSWRAGSASGSEPVPTS